MKILTVIMTALILLSTAIVVNAATFDGQAGEISGSVIGNEATITVSGIGDVKAVVQYRMAGDKKPIAYPLKDGKVKLNAAEGDRIQLLNSKDEYLFISPEWCASRHNPVKLNGVACDFTYPEAALQLK